MKRTIFICIYLWISLSLSAATSVWQWSTEIPTFTSSETNAHPRAFLWIPESCKQVRAVIVGKHNMSEEPIFEHPAFRKAMEELGFAIIWITPVMDINWDVTTGVQVAFDDLMNRFAELSGYQELAFAPIVPIGHSAMATYPWNFAAWNPERTLAVLSIHGDAPQTHLTGYGRKNLDWGNRTIEAVPSLMVMGEYEWWEDRLFSAFAYRRLHPDAPVSMLADAGHGHFDSSDALIDYLTLFLKKAARERLPKQMPLDRPATLIPVRASDGYLKERWHRDVKPHYPSAPYREYAGESANAFWYFDRKMAEATEQYYALQRGKQEQYIGFVQDGQLLSFDPKSHARMNARFMPQADGLTFHLKTAFTDSLRSRLNNNHATGCPIITRICGPVEKVNDTTFTVRFYRMGLNNVRRTNDIWLLASHQGDKVYKSCVQQLNLRIPFRNTEGMTQKITFPKLPNVQKGTRSVTLSATSNSGLPVYYYIKEGPAEIRDNRIYFTKLPPRARLPLKVTVVAWQYGRSIEPKWQTAEAVERSFYIGEHANRYDDAQKHPCIYVSATNKASLQQKINNEPWASEAFRRIQTLVEPYADRHLTNPEWITSRLAMYWKEGERYTQCYLKKQNWDRGEGNAPVPTVRMPGMRTWNKYFNVPLEDRTPYNETGDMWGIDKMNPNAPRVLVSYKESGHMVRGNNVEILTLAEKASFLYWVTNEEKYARFAADIFNTWLVGTYYMNPILDPTKSCGSEGGWAAGGICGYYDYEQIHDDLALHAATAYDFLYNYLAQHPHNHLRQLGKITKDVAATVFKRFIDIGLIRGGKEGNWNVNGWNMMLRPILVLEENSAYPDGKGREYYLHYLTTESTPYHDAIPDMLRSYDPVTGLWPESPGYSFGTIQMILDFSVQLQRTGIDIVADNPILQKATLAAFPWMDERANMVVFGDSRGGSANFQTFEYLLAYYTQQQKAEGVNQVAAALNKGIELGQYNRSAAGWEGICTYLASVPATTAMVAERTSYSLHHRFMTMKNFIHSEVGNTDARNLMATLYGGRKGCHLTPNGLALQLYGYGYALAPDAAAYESYWSKDHTYHQSPTGCNTILPGYTEGDITVNAAEPMVREGAFINDKELTPFINFADLTAKEKRRTVILVKNASGEGYYVDIFRSDLMNNDYLHHNIGTSLTLTDTTGKPLVPTPVNDLGTAYHNGYAWLINQRKVCHDETFKACWQMPENMSMNMWMLGAKGRELYQVDAPATTLNKGLTPGNCCMPPTATPTLIVRQQGNNASKHPFVAVFEPSKNKDNAVLRVNRLAETEQLIALQVSSKGNREDYLFSTTMQRTERKSVQFVKGISFEGTFGLVSEVSGKPEMLYLGNGKVLRKGSFGIEAANNVYAAIYQQKGEWYYSATGKVTVTFGKNKLTLGEGYHLPILSATRQVSHYDFTPMDSLISDWMKREYYPGASIVIMKNDTVLFEKQYGSYTPDTEVYIASAGKWLAAAAIAAIVDQTKLSWDDPVQCWLPEFQDDPKGNITLRQLLSHTSGIRPYQPEPKRDVHNILANAVAEILPLDTVFAGGSRFEYGGLAMQVAGRMAEVAAGMDFETIFQKKIAQPLGMKRTHFTPVDLGGGHSPMLGGGARTVLHDYIRFLKMIFHEGNYQGRQVLSKQAVREMQADQVRGAKVLPGEYVEKGLGLHHTGIYGLGEWREKIDDQGEAYQISSPGWAGAYPWMNKRDGVYGFFLTHVEGDATRKDGFSPFYNAPILSALTTKLLKSH